MGWTQQIEYVDVEVTLPPPVRKQVWNGEKFVPMTLYKHSLSDGMRWAVLNKNMLTWLEKTYGRPGIYVKGRYWDYTRAGNFFVMDEQVYTWFQMKWGNK